MVAEAASRYLSLPPTLTQNVSCAPPLTPRKLVSLIYDLYQLEKHLWSLTNWIFYS